MWNLGLVHLRKELCMKVVHFMLINMQFKEARKGFLLM